MNEKPQEFLQGMGIMTELWMVTYNNFRKQGLSHSESLDHTAAFTKAIMEYAKEAGAQ